ncbi:MAG: class I SAM-dependent methyltransferase [Methanobacteriota archaeon]|nr:MAG: class I SAM-dependent methyltransferase [Euryarchaeota archaeon]
MARGTPTYDRFARYYDFIYEDLVDYDADVRYLEALFRRFLPRKPVRVLDLGCGTGNHALRLARRRYEVTGLDRSRAQLALARRKARAAGLPIRFIAGDMRSFRLGARFDAAICMFGAFGYLLRTRDVTGALRSIRRHLSPGGLFAFEFWQSSAARPAPHLSWVHRTGPAFELVRLDAARYDPRTQMLPIDFHFFVFKGRRMLDRFDETHTVRTYRVAEMRGLLVRSGFDVSGMYRIGARLKKGVERPRRDTFRVFVAARSKA